jgi:hypothetical protein
MSRPARRKELAERYEREDAARRAEEVRKDGLTMWERIEEADCNGDLRDILHRFAQKLGMEM